MLISNFSKQRAWSINPNILNSSRSIGPRKNFKESRLQVLGNFWVDQPVKNLVITVNMIRGGKNVKIGRLPQKGFRVNRCVIIIIQKYTFQKHKIMLKLTYLNKCFQQSEEWLPISRPVVMTTSILRTWEAWSLTSLGLWGAVLLRDLRSRIGLFWASMTTHDVLASWQNTVPQYPWRPNTRAM